MSIKEVLPLDYMLHIFSFLDSRTLAKRVSLVCTKWRDLSNHDNLWRQLCIKDFSTDLKFNDHLSWKDLYHMVKDHEKEFQGVQRRMLVGMLEDLESDSAFSDPGFGVRC